VGNHPHPNPLPSREREKKRELRERGKKRVKGEKGNVGFSRQGSLSSFPRSSIGNPPPRSSFPKSLIGNPCFYFFFLELYECPLPMFGFLIEAFRVTLFLCHSRNLQSGIYAFIKTFRPLIETFRGRLKAA